VALQDPDSNKEEECPRDTVEGDVGQEVGVEAGGPEKVCPLHAHQYVCQIFHFKVHQGEQWWANQDKVQVLVAVG
jgi:hypothetical protein